jgi:hypothetical protein
MISTTKPDDGTVFRQVSPVVTRKKPYLPYHSFRFEKKGLSSEERWHQIIWFSAKKDLDPGYSFKLCCGQWQSKAASSATAASWKSIIIIQPKE